MRPDRRAPSAAAKAQARAERAARRELSRRATAAAREARAAAKPPRRKVATRTNSRADYNPGRFREGIPKRRLRVVFGVVAALLVVVLGRVALLQTTEAKAYQSAGASQRERTNVLRADRGVIFDRDGTELAMSVPRTSIYADPRAVGDAVGTAAVLARILGFDEEKQAKLAGQLGASTKSFVYVARLLDDATAKAVIDLHLDGIGALSEPARVVTAGDLAASVIGTTNDFGEGSTGLELQYEDILQGVDGESVTERDSAGRSLPGGSEVVKKPEPGEDLVLTIDRSIQYQTEQALVQRVQELQAAGGTAIIMDVHTGEIYALANVTTGDDGVARTTSANLAEVNAHEPGSVAKVFTASAAINEGLVTPDSSFMVPGSRILDHWNNKDYVIRDAESHGTIPMTVNDILVHSSNIGTTMLSDLLGPAKQEQYMRLFGLGAATGLGFPDESTGKLKPSTEWQGSEKLTPSYGYGFTATSTQMIAAVNTIANGGVYVAPKLVKGIINDQGVMEPTPASESHTVISPAAAEQMNLMMRNVVDYGTATRAKVAGVTVAGKTGTSYKAQSNKTYTDASGKKAYYATFVGTFPAEDPQVTILVSIDEPNSESNDRFGGTASAPLFADLAQITIGELEIKPPAAAVAAEGQ